MAVEATQLTSCGGQKFSDAKLGTSQNLVGDESCDFEGWNFDTHYFFMQTQANSSDLTTLKTHSVCTYQRNLVSPGLTDISLTEKIRFYAGFARFKLPGSP